ncbi:RHS Repeat family protein [Shigella boydii 965-58]|nr:RHS Repeat family protein [Shigella boydii 965-58]
MSGKPAARQGDMTQYGGSIVQGSAGVRIGAPTGVACSVCPGGVTSGHPVNPLLGAKVLPGETDLALPGPLPFILSRTYSSYRTKTPAPVGSLGPGWKMPADIRLQLRDNTLILSDNGGRRLYFEHLFPGEDGYSRSESLWLVRGGVAKLDEGHRLAALWQALPEELRLSPHRYLATNSPQGPWWLLGWCERVPEADVVTGLITRITTPDGRASAFYYNHHNQLTSATGPDGLELRREYDESGRLIQETAPDGDITRYRYDNPHSDLPCATDDATGSRKTMTWSRYGQLLSFTDCSGYQTRYDHDRFGQMTAVHREEGLSIFRIGG